jgi:hypothetical protein
MMDHGGMMWGMGLIGILLIVVLVLAAAALVKYSSSPNAHEQGITEFAVDPGLGCPRHV